MIEREEREREREGGGERGEKHACKMKSINHKCKGSCFFYQYANANGANLFSQRLLLEQFTRQRPEFHPLFI